MTRFPLSLDEAIGLVEYAFTHAESGDLFVRNSPADNVQGVAMAICELEGVTPEFRVIGTRHAEKLFETPLSGEEMVRATDKGAYFRVRLDARSVDYGLFFDQVGEKIWNEDDLTSLNATRLNQTSISKLLKELPDFDGPKNEYPPKQLSPKGPRSVVASLLLLKISPYLMRRRW